MASVAEAFTPTPHFSPEQGGLVGYDPRQMASLFSILSLPLGAVANLETAVAATQPWVKGDHGHESYDFGLNDDQRNALWGIYHARDMVEQRALPAGHYDQILVFGAVHIGNDKRLAYLRNTFEGGDVSTDRIVLLGGERAMFPEREPEDVAQSIASVLQKQHADTWFQKFIQKSPEAIDETDLLRLAALDHLGPMVLKQLRLHIGEELKWRTKTPVVRTEFGWQGVPLTLSHSRAHPRKDGDPRHTTESCVVDWLIELQPKLGSKVAIIGSQPHLDRMTMTVQRVLHGKGREDIQITAGGPNTTDATGHTIYLGEIARAEYERLQLLQSRL